MAPDLDGCMADHTTGTIRRWAWVAASIAGALLILIFLALPAGAIEQSAVYDMVGLLTVMASLAGLRLHRPAGWLPWLILIIGQAAFVAGDIVWTTYAALGDDPFPSFADVLYLAGYPLLAIGLAVAIRRRVSGGDRAGILDGAILATGAVVMWWAFVLGPVAAASDPDPLAFSISVAYPVGDLLLIGLALGLVMVPGSKSASFRLLVTNLAILLLGDLLFGLQSVNGTYVDGGPLDAVWLLAYVAFAAAALHPSMGAVFDPRPAPVTLLGRVRLALLAAAMLVGPVLLLLERGHRDGIDLIVAAATALVSILVLTRLAGVVGHLARDIERRTVLEEQLSFQAFHDPLTGLANRRRFIDAVGASLAEHRETALLFLDLDDFKHVNDELGHDAGDALLTAAGHRLVSAIRPGDLACRIGGDEFAVLLPATGRLADAEAVGHRLLDALSVPIHIDGRELLVQASIGAAIAPPGTQLQVDELLRRADVSMYQAKAAGKNQLAIYDPALDRGPAATEPIERHIRTPRVAPSA
jgi:diguanylate cyclase (GGDEF)-like protein